MVTIYGSNESERIKHMLKSDTSLKNSNSIQETKKHKKLCARFNLLKQVQIISAIASVGKQEHYLDFTLMTMIHCDLSITWLKCHIQRNASQIIY